MQDKELNGNALKIIAMITMLIDHVGWILIGQGILPRLVSGSVSYKHWFLVYQICRSIGRIAFPVFCFLLVEGFLHTRSRKNYAIRLFIFTLISEIPFNLAVTGQLSGPQSQNVMVTLLLGFLTLIGLTKVRRLIPSLLVILAGCAVAWFLHVDYRTEGVMLIVILYWYRSDKKLQLLIGAIWMIANSSNVQNMVGIAAAFALLALYNGERGKLKLKMAWYWFYPVHLLILVGIRNVLRHM